MDFVSQAGDEVALDQIPRTTELGIVWLRAYLAHREQFDVTDAGLRELLRQWRASGRATLQLNSACFADLAGHAVLESQSAFGLQALSEVSAALPQRACLGSGTN